MTPHGGGEVPVHQRPLAITARWLNHRRLLPDTSGSSAGPGLMLKKLQKKYIISEKPAITGPGIDENLQPRQQLAANEMTTHVVRLTHDFSL